MYKHFLPFFISVVVGVGLHLLNFGFRIDISSVIQTLLRILVGYLVLEGILVVVRRFSDPNKRQARLVGKSEIIGGLLGIAYFLIVLAMDWYFSGGESEAFGFLTLFLHVPVAPLVLLFYEILGFIDLVSGYEPPWWIAYIFSNFIVGVLLAKGIVAHKKKVSSSKNRGITMGS